MTKSSIMIWIIYYMIYISQFIFALNKIFMIYKNLIPKKFHNSWHQCQYHKKIILAPPQKKIKVTEDK